MHQQQRRAGGTGEMQTKSWGERREEERKEEEQEEYGKEAEGGSGWRGMKNRWTNK